MFWIIYAWVLASEIFLCCVVAVFGYSATVCQPTANQSELNSFLWAVKRDAPSYFFGTIHVPYTKVWDYIPENTKKAFQDSDNIFFELDLTDSYTISALATCQLLPHGKSLADILPEDIYTRLKDHLNYVKTKISSWITDDQRGRGLYADYLFNAIAGNWERKRPVWVMLMVNSLTESDIKSRGVPVLDLYLSQEAERLSKRTGAVERVEEQCIPLNELNFSQVVFALNQTLWQHEHYRLGLGTMPYTTDDLIEHYNCGDLNSVIFNHDTAQVHNLVNTSLPPQDMMTAKSIDDYFRQELIYIRNRRMAQRVMRVLKAHPKKTFFFAFGAGHFLGNSTILDHLKQQGFEVEHVKPWHTLPQNKYKKRERKKNLLAVPGMSSDYPVSTISLNGHPLDPFLDSKIYKKRHRKRNRRKKKKSRRRKKKTRLDNFNDLWVRIETTSQVTETTYSVETFSDFSLDDEIVTSELKSGCSTCYWMTKLTVSVACCWLVFHAIYNP